MKYAKVWIESFKKKALHKWLPCYFWHKLYSREGIDRAKPVHIFLCVVDHYEPFHTGVDYERAHSRVKTWVKEYPSMAEKHKDAEGRPPQHTWFYPPHLDHIFLKDLADLCQKGFGEIEMHLHHNHMHPFPDTPESLKKKILKCLDDYSHYGIFCLPNGQRKFAFIHGDWSLDNSRGPSFCGVNNEISILKECGCYADFTFPSLGVAQPAMLNKMYYAIDNPLKPKSYNRGRPVKFGGKPWGDLMLIQGVLGLRWHSSVHRYKPSIETSNISRSDYLFPERIDYLVNNAVRVDGQPNWFFIKLHTHGCRDMDFVSIFGDQADKAYTYLENKYNDKRNYVLHYVSAREMYNIIKASEAGLRDWASGYRDFIIPRYSYLSE